MDLFRREALDAQRQSWLGEIAVMRPVPVSVGVGFVVVALIAVLVFLCLASYERKLLVSGVLVPDRSVVRVQSPEAGTVAEVIAQEGQAVRQGEALVVIDAGLAPAPPDVQPAARRRLVVRAPVDGVMATAWAVPGQAIEAAEPLVSLLPSGTQLQAQLMVPSMAVGHVRSGQPLWLRYRAFAYQEFGHQAGHVLQVSRTPSSVTAPPDAKPADAPPAAAAGEPLYRITVALDQQALRGFDGVQPLSAGMQVEAHVPLERRRLIEWMFEPLLGLAGRLSPSGG